MLRQRCDARGFTLLPIENIARRKVAPAFEAQRDGERAVPRTKRGHDTRLEWAPACTCNVLFGDLLSFKSDTRKEAPLQRNGRVRP